MMARSDSSAASASASASTRAAEEEEDPVFLEPLIVWNGDERRGYWLRPSEAPSDWWAGIEDVTSRVMITAGIFECFRDDIHTFEATLRALLKGDGSGPALEVNSFLDDAVHATLVNDFAFGIAPGEQMEGIISWLKRALRRPQE